MDVSIVDRPQLRIAGIRHIGPYREIGREFARLGGLLKGPPPAGSQMIAIYHDDPATTAPDHLRSDAALLLTDGMRTPNGLIEQRVPAGRYARAVHNGSYEGLPAAWDALKNDWLPASGHRAAHPSYELYLNTPMTVKSEELITELYLRVE